MLQPFSIAEVDAEAEVTAASRFHDLLPRHQLDAAFASFADVATNLQLAYASLQGDVARLRRELTTERAARHRSESMAEVAAVLAHEVRNPLASLEIFAALLSGAPELSPASRSHTLHLQAGLRSLEATVNTVLQFHSPTPLVLAPVDVGELLEWARDFLSPLAMQSRVQLRLEHALHGVRVMADLSQLQQVLLNLALNSLQHSGAGSSMVIRGKCVAKSCARTCNDDDKGKDRGERKDEWAGVIEIAVCDEGAGIASANLPHIFEANFTTKPGGTGLGLAVVRKIADQHSAEVHVHSELGCGTTVTLTLTGLGASRSAGKGTF